MLALNLFNSVTIIHHFCIVYIIIYINDLSNCLNKSSAILYANVATLYTKHDNIYLLCDILTLDLKNVNE